MIAEVDTVRINDALGAGSDCSILSIMRCQRPCDLQHHLSRRYVPRTLHQRPAPVILAIVWHREYAGLFDERKCGKRHVAVNYFAVVVLAGRKLSCDDICTKHAARGSLSNAKADPIGPILNELAVIDKQSEAGGVPGNVDVVPEAGDLAELDGALRVLSEIDGLPVYEYATRDESERVTVNFGYVHVLSFATAATDSERAFPPLPLMHAHIYAHAHLCLCSDVVEWSADCMTYFCAVACHDVVLGSRIINASFARDLSRLLAVSYSDSAVPPGGLKDSRIVHRRVNRSGLIRIYHHIITVG